MFIFIFIILFLFYFNLPKLNFCFYSVDGIWFRQEFRYNSEIRHPAALGLLGDPSAAQLLYKNGGGGGGGGGGALIFISLYPHSL